MMYSRFLIGLVLLGSLASFIACEELPVEPTTLSAEELDVEVETTTDVELIYSDSAIVNVIVKACLLYTSPSPRDRTRSRMPSSA